MAYNSRDNFCPCQEAQTARPGTSPAPPAVVQGTPGCFPRNVSTEREAARILRRSLRIEAEGDRQERIADTRFIAGECGARFVFDPNNPTDADPDGLHVDGAGWIDEKTREAAAMVSIKGSYGLVTHEQAVRDSQAYLRSLAKAKDIDPKGPPVEVAGETLDAVRASILQGLARNFLNPATRQRLEEGELWVARRKDRRALLIRLLVALALVFELGNSMEALRVRKFYGSP